MAAVSLESPFPALTLRDVPAIVEETLSSGSTAANPRSVDASAVEFLLRKIFSVA
jgi:alcohol dehydrogenase class IV